MSNEEDKLFVQIAKMYYEENMTQSEISRVLGIHRTSISRLLKRIREEGIVKISIDYKRGGTLQIEEKIKELFSLQDLIVVPSGVNESEDTRTKSLGRAAANYLVRIIKPSDKVGLSWGKTLSSFVEELPTQLINDVLFLPMIGGPSGRLKGNYHVNTIVFEAAKKFNCKSMLIDSPAIVDSKELCEALKNSDYNKKLAGLWEELDIAIFGIGTPLISTSQRWKDFYGKEIVGDILRNKATGDIVSRFFNAEGAPCHLELNDRLIGISLETIRNIPNTIAVAESNEKVEGIISALRGGYVRTLITNEETLNEIAMRVSVKEIE